MVFQRGIDNKSFVHGRPFPQDRRPALFFFDRNSFPLFQLHSTVPSSWPVQGSLGDSSDGRWRFRPQFINTPFFFPFFFSPRGFSNTVNVILHQFLFIYLKKIPQSLAWFPGWNITPNLLACQNSSPFPCSQEIRDRGIVPTLCGFLVSRAPKATPFKDTLTVSVNFNQMTQGIIPRGAC